MNSRPHSDEPEDADIEAPPLKDVNAERAAQGGMAALVAVGKHQTAIDTGNEPAVEFDNVIDAVAILLELAEGLGWFPELVVIEAIRVHAKHRAAELEESCTSGRFEFECGTCEQHVFEAPRWYRRCHRCQAARSGREKDGFLPYDEEGLNEFRAEWAEGAVQMFSALTRWGWDYLSTDQEGQEEILADLISNLGHLAARDGHDPAAIYQRGMASFEDETPNTAD